MKLKNGWIIKIYTICKNQYMLKLKENHKLKWWITAQN